MLAQQENYTRASKAFEKMLALNISPNDNTFIHLMNSYAKRKQIDKVFELNEVAIKEYDLKPSVSRMNVILLAFAKLERAEEAEDFLR